MYVGCVLKLGVWRRRPDAKWRLRPQQLADRRREQQAVLALAAPLVKPGGRLAYITCSVLEEENTDRVAALIAADATFSVTPPGSLVDAYEREAMIEIGGRARLLATGLLLTPRSSGTDGFFVSVLQKRG